MRTPLHSTRELPCIPRDIPHVNSLAFRATFTCETLEIIREHRAGEFYFVRTRIAPAKPAALSQVLA
jgi:hypothetical protein